MQTLTTASDVRKFLSAPENADLFNTLSEAAKRTIVGSEDKAPRGRIHPDARDAFNSVHKGKSAYKEGTPRTVELSYRRKQPSGRTVKATVNLPESAIRGLAAEAGVAVGERGPLSKAVLVAAGEQYAKVAAE